MRRAMLALLVVIRVGGLIDKPLDLEHNCRDEGRQNKEAEDNHEGAFLNAGVHPDERDQQQRRNTKGDGGKNEDRVR